MTKIILKYRWLIIAVSLVIALGGAMMIPGMKTDPDIRNYIPPTIESRLNTDIIEKEFGVQDMIMILFRDSLILTAENLNRIRQIDRKLGRMSWIGNTISLFSTKRIYGEEGAMIVDPAVKRIPGNREDIEKLKDELSDNPLAMGIVISEDFSMSVIAATIGQKMPEEELLARVDSIVAEYPGGAEVLYGGLPFIRKYIMQDVRRDGIILIPMALLIMLGFLWIVFREWRGMVLPFTVVALSIAISMGLVPLLGWNLSILSLLVPIMLIAVANDYGIHMIARYQEINVPSNRGNMNTIVRDVVRKLRKPVLFTGLTTIAGILGLLTHSIIPARQVGVLAAVGVAIAIALSLFMLPAWLSLLKRASPRKFKPESGNGFLDRLLHRTAKMITGRPVRVLIISALITLIFSTGIFLIRVDGNMENFFPSRHPVKVSSELINNNFGGSQSISLMAEGDFMDPDNLAYLDRWSGELQDIDGVGNVYSISKVIREMSKALYDENEHGYDMIPQSREAVAQMVELYNMSGDPDDFERLVNFDYTRAHMIIRLEKPETEVINTVLARLDELTGPYPEDVIKGGYAFIMSEFASKIVRGQISSLIFAVSVVLILLMIIFRSFRGGLIATIPIIASLLFLLGFMGIARITLNSATALLSSIMIGVGVDYTIHFIWRYKSELRVRNYSEAVYKTLTTTGRGVVFNALSVMVGFSVLLFSGFTSIRFFGYLVLISIGVCLVSAVLVIPSIMLVFKPGFVEPYIQPVRLHNNKIKNIMRRAIMLIIIILGTISLNAQTFGANEIMEKSREAMKVDAFEAASLLKITDSRGNTRERTNITASKSFDDGTEKRLIKFLTPPEVSGTSMLIYDYDEGQDDMWIYLPALRKTRRIVSSEKGKSFMGSEFTNSDMSSPPLADFVHKLVAGQDNSVWIIESFPAGPEKEDEYGYSRKISYILKENFTLKRMEYYNFDDELFKVIEVRELEDIGDGSFMIRHMTAENLIDGRSSEIIIKEISTGATISDELFNLASLSR